LRLLPGRLREPPLYVWAKTSGGEADAVAAARLQAREAAAGEHRRLLYVAMTRAAQRLVVAGHETSRGRPSDCWYDLVHAGLADSLVEAPAPFDGGETILSYGEGLRAEDDAETPQIRPPKTSPRWLVENAAHESSAPPLSPSRVGDASAGDRERAHEGRVAHALLEMLPGVAPDRRASVASAYLDARGAALAESTRAQLAAKVLAAIGAPELSRLFGPDSRGEVPLMGVLRRRGRPDLPYSGRLDRLAATGESVLIVDFKLGAKPDRPAAAHVAQLAIYRAALQPLYPGLAIRAALVHLDGPTLAPVSEEELAAALDAVTLGQ
jgi:ATP-dependent helicase/nuclease subunit A